MVAITKVDTFFFCSVYLNTCVNNHQCKGQRPIAIPTRAGQECTPCRLKYINHCVPRAPVREV